MTSEVFQTTELTYPRRGARGCSNENNPPCVLHVDDDAVFSAALKRRLEAHGVAVVRAFDGDDGIEQSQRYEMDAVLLDLEMPNTKGDEVLTILRKNEVTREIPVIVLTGRKDPQLEQRMALLGASAYITKPLRFEELREQLAKYIDILPKPGLAP